MKSLPLNLDATYYRILNGIHERFTALASRALRWLVFSSRTLFIEELIDACAIDLDRTPQPVLGTKLKPYQLLEMLHDMISIRPALASFDAPPAHGLHTINLCHASVGEFLQRIGSPSARGPGYNPRMDVFLVERQAANLRIARACLAYLFYYNIPGAHTNEFPLLGYSWYRWEKHVGASDEHEEVSDDSSIIRAKASSIYMELSASGVSHGSVASCLDWLRHSQKDRLLDALNVPYYYPNFESFFKLPQDQRQVYEPMEDLHNSTRVLELLPCLDTSTTIRFRLLVEDLEDLPAYIAVSYGFGSPHPQELAMVHGQTKGLFPNLARILRMLRSRKEGAVSKVWLDALCINQEDTLERSYQLPLMSRIFSQAQEVVVSLGKKPPNAAQGLAVLKDMAAVTQIMPQTNGQDGRGLRWQALSALKVLEEDGNSKALASLFPDAWWTRLWLLQELVIASNAIMVMDDLSFSCTTIESAVTAESILQRHLQYSERRRWRRQTAFPGWAAAKRLFKTRTQRGSHGGHSLHPLFWRLRHDLVADQRDQVYALLGMYLISDSSQAQLIPDYGSHVAVTSLMYTSLAIMNYKNLDALSIASTLPSDSPPSWTINLATSHVPKKRPLVLGVFGWPQHPSPYAAMGPESHHEKEGPDRHCEHWHWETLRARGYVLGSVLRVDSLTLDWEKIASDHAAGANGHVPHTLSDALRGLCDRISGWERPDGLNQVPQQSMESPTTIRWRTLLADQWPMGQRLASGLFMDKPIPRTEEDEASLLRDIEIEDEDMPFLRGRGVMVTDEGVLGLGPEEARSGDLIAFLFGGSVPYILRAEGGDYRLVGEW